MEEYFVEDESNYGSDENGEIDDVDEIDEDFEAEEAEESEESKSENEEEAEETEEDEEEEEDVQTPFIIEGGTEFSHKNMTNFEYSRLIEEWAELLRTKNLDPVLESDLTDIVEIAAYDINNAREEVPLVIVRQIGNQRIRIPLDQLNLPPRLAF